MAEDVGELKIEVGKLYKMMRRIIGKALLLDHRNYPGKTNKFFSSKYHLSMFCGNCRIL